MFRRMLGVTDRKHWIGLLYSAYDREQRAKWKLRRSAIESFVSSTGKTP